MNVFTAIRKDSRDWWFHAKLRKEGKIQKARELENKSTRSDIKHIHEVYFVMIHNNGHTMWLNNHTKVEGYKRIDHPSIQLMIARGIPVIDLTTIRPGCHRQYARISMIAVPPDLPENKFGPFNFEDIVYVADAYKKLGITIYNVKGVNNG